MVFSVFQLQTGAESVEWIPLVRVDGDTEEAGVGVDQLVLIAHHGVPEDAGVAKERQIGHVLRAVELDRRRSESVSVLRFTYLGGVDLADSVSLVRLGLALKY